MLRFTEYFLLKKGHNIEWAECRRPLCPRNQSFPRTVFRNPPNSYLNLIDCVWCYAPSFVSIPQSEPLCFWTAWCVRITGRLSSSSFFPMKTLQSDSPGASCSRSQTARVEGVTVICKSISKRQWQDSAPTPPPSLSCSCSPLLSTPHVQIRPQNRILPDRRCNHPRPSTLPQCFLFTQAVLPPPHFNSKRSKPVSFLVITQRCLPISQILSSLSVETGPAPRLPPRNWGKVHYQQK